jgi:hypothetical protein
VLSSDDFGSRVERTAKLHPLCTVALREGGVGGGGIQPGSLWRLAAVTGRSLRCRREDAADLGIGPETADMVGGRWVEHLAARNTCSRGSQHVVGETGAFAASVVSGIVGPAQTRQATVEVTKDSNPIQGNGCGLPGAEDRTSLTSLLRSHPACVASLAGQQGPGAATSSGGSVPARGSASAAGDSTRDQGPLRRHGFATLVALHWA